jgi:hypothetical protein
MSSSTRRRAFDLDVSIEGLHGLNAPKSRCNGKLDIATFARKRLLSIKKDEKRLKSTILDFGVESHSE